MNPRILALILLVAMLGFAGMMASVGLLVRDPLPVVARHQSLTVESDALTPPVTVRMSFDGAFAVAMEIAHPGRQAAPEIRLAPHDGGAIPLDLDASTAERTRAEGQLTRPGRWELTIIDGATHESRAFIVQD